MAKRRHVMTAKRHAALRKAQMVSARKRRGRGVSKTSIRKYRKTAVAKKHGRRRIAKRVAITAGAGLAIGAGAYGSRHLWRNRERMIVAPMAEHQAVLAARLRGVKGKQGLARARRQERIDHAHRSSYMLREYKLVQSHYRTAASMGLNIRPGHARSLPHMQGKDIQTQHYMYKSYKKYRKVRAQHRLARLQGKKATGFSYKSGNTRMVFGRRVVRVPW